MLCPARYSNLTGGNTNKLAILSIFPILPPCFNQSPELLGHKFKNLRDIHKFINNYQKQPNKISIISYRSNYALSSYQISGIQFYIKVSDTITDPSHTL